MEQMITVDEKRTFLKWFLGKHQLKSRECVWLINYMISDNRLIDNLIFVENATACPRAMIITEKDVEKAPFLYRKKQVETDQPEKAFHDIRMDHDEPIFLQLNFKNPFMSAEYVAVLEENPYYHPSVDPQYGEVAEDVIHRTENKFKKQKLHEAINDALDRGDRETFNRLTEELKSLDPC